MDVSPIFFAYVGPEVTMPMASVLAAVIGFLLMVGRAPIQFAARLFRSVRGWFRPRPVRTPQATPVEERGPVEDLPSPG